MFEDWPAVAAMRLEVEHEDDIPGAREWIDDGDYHDSPVIPVLNSVTRELVGNTRVTRISFPTLRTMRLEFDVADIATLPRRDSDGE